jgi:ADP-ribosylation factor protein 1
MIGKTTLLYRLKLGDIITAVPTIGTFVFFLTMKGFNVETVAYKTIDFTVWDVTKSAVRPIFSRYLDKEGIKVYFVSINAKIGLIYVVDSTDEDRIEIAAEELQKMLKGKFNLTNKIEELFAGCPLLVFANKQDLKSCLPLEDIVTKLGLNNVQSREWHVQPCSAIE